MKRLAAWTVKAVRFAGFILLYGWELLLSNLTVARQVLSPGFGMRPAILAVPLEPVSDAELVVLANLISMTPGSLSLDVSSCRRFLYVHVMDANELERVRRRLQELFQRPLREVFRS